MAKVAQHFEDPHLCQHLLNWPGKRNGRIAAEHAHVNASPYLVAHCVIGLPSRATGHQSPRAAQSIRRPDSFNQERNMQNTRPQAQRRVFEPLRIEPANTAHSIDE
jgi:hypothetical protein